jgi:hypothetical protein
VNRTGAATAGLAVPALMALGMSGDTSYRFLGTALQITDTWERGLLCGVAEAAIVALTVYSWATRARGAAYLAYAAVLIQAIPAFQVSGATGGPVRVALGPVLLAVMLHLLLGLEVRMSGTRPDSLWRATGREARERLTAWLGIGRRGADSAAIARSRAADRAVALADLTAAVGPDTRRYRRRAARLAAAIDAARHGLDAEDAAAAEAAIVGRIVRRKSVGDLATIGLRHAWTTAEVTTDMTTEVTVERADTPDWTPLAELDFAPVQWPPAVIAEPAGMTRKVTAFAAAQQPRQVVTAQVTITPAELRRQARKLHRQVVAETGRPVTIDRLRAELGLSRREATELRHSIVEGAQS